MHFNHATIFRTSEKGCREERLQKQGIFLSSKNNNFAKTQLIPTQKIFLF
jgi:hypothetical protein